MSTRNDLHSATQFFTPSVVIDDVSLRFSSGFGEHQAFEAMATLLTFTTFDVKARDVVMEAYESVSLRLDEEGWYALATRYYRSYLASLATADRSTLLSLWGWLEVHFFDRFNGYEEVRQLISVAVGHTVARVALQPVDLSSLGLPHQPGNWDGIAVSLGIGRGTDGSSRPAQSQAAQSIRLQIRRLRQQAEAAASMAEGQRERRASERDDDGYGALMSRYQRNGTLH